MRGCPFPWDIRKIPRTSSHFARPAGTWDWRPAALCLDPSCRARSGAEGPELQVLQFVEFSQGVQQVVVLFGPWLFAGNLFILMWFNVYLCVYGFYVCAFVRLCILACWYVCACMDALTYVSLCISVHITLHISVYPCISVYMCAYVCIQSMYSYYMYCYFIIRYRLKKKRRKKRMVPSLPHVPGELPIHPCIYPSICIHIYIYIYIYTPINIYKPLSTYLCNYASLCDCIFAMLLRSVSACTRTYV